MKIGIDARPLQSETQYRGIGKALGFMLEGLKNVMPSNTTLVFYVDDGLPVPDLLNIFTDAKIIPLTSSPLGRMRYVRSVLPSYTQLKVKPRDVDVVLQYDAALGVPKNVPTLVMFHDLIPYLFRGQEKRQTAAGMRKLKNELAGNLYWRKYLRFLNTYKSANHIAAISQSSRQDLLNHFKNIPESRVSVIHLGNRPLVADGIPSESIKKMDQTPYLLYVGGIDFRKNVTGLLKAFYVLKPNYPDLKLVTVGKEFTLQDQLNDLGWTKVLNSNKDYAKDVIVPGFLSESELLYLYEHATAFVFPSRYEGFGLPVIEAMQAGCPVVAYKNSSIPEVAGNAALLVEDGSDLSAAVKTLLSSKTLQKELIAKGKKQAAAFSWEHTAQETLKQLKALV